jgi:hypothetical protein
MSAYPWSQYHELRHLGQRWGAEPWDILSGEGNDAARGIVRGEGEELVSMALDPWAYERGQGGGAGLAH